MVIIHCSATPAGKDYTVEDIDKWHKARGFDKIGYHYVIYRDGSIHQGRLEQEVGAHCKGYNANSIGVCYIGGLLADGKKPEDTRTEAQKKSLLQLLKHLKVKYPGVLICGHRDLSEDLNGDGTIEPFEWVKSCPSFDAHKEYAHI